MNQAASLSFATATNSLLRLGGRLVLSRTVSLSPSYESLRARDHCNVTQRQDLKIPSVSHNKASLSSCSATEELRSSDILDNRTRRFYDCLSAARAERVAKVIQSRTRHVAIVLEEVLGSHNCAAVLRTADAFGVQDVHLIRADPADDCKGSLRKRAARSVSKGAEKWLTLRKYANSRKCVEYLKQNGYKIYVSSLAKGAKPLSKLNFDEKAALLFGNEVRGVTKEVEELADERFVIQNVGFVESYNVSVAVSITLTLVIPQCLRNLPPSKYQLTRAGKREVLLRWLTPLALAKPASPRDFDPNLGELATVDVTAF